MELALDDMDATIDYIARENPQAAERVAKQIWTSGESIGDNPRIGRPGRLPDSREWVVSHTPYVLAYRIKSNQIEIMRVLHGRQSWPETLV
ncbi:MAG: type II toxin-antitoxin system RelE/ParE family toxin [Proteobacteria bacterium]|nr:type II toxin-antitoxin system RelE/ParE family toxin [Pseudomonadota bacterium]